MDIRQFRYFIATAEEGHLGRAAARLHLSQPALTRQIQLLEQDFGGLLFTRTPRGMLLTAMGERLLADARNVHELFEQTIERTRRLGRGELGALDIGTFGTALFDYVPRLLARFSQRFPEVTLRLHHAPMEALLVALRQGRVQVVFERRMINEPDIACQVVTREAAFVAIHEHHALAAETSVDIMALQHEPLIGGREAGRLRGAIEFCREHGFEPMVVAEAPDMAVAVALVAGGMGSCIVPESLLNLRLPGMTYRPLDARFDTCFDLYSYHLRQSSSPTLERLMTLLDTPTDTTTP